MTLVRLYQFILSPFLGGNCRFYPSCSEFAVQAFETHRPAEATKLVLNRLLRCHPLSQSGYDPVPQKVNSHV